MEKINRNIIIGIFSSWAFRNIFLTKIYEELNKRYVVYVATSPEYMEVIKDYTENIIVIEKINQGKILNFFHKLLIKCFVKKSALQTVSEIRNKTITKNEYHFKSYIVNKSILILSSIIVFFNLHLLLEKLWLGQMKKQIPQKKISDIKKINPDLILLTSIVLPKEQSLYFIGQMLKIKTILHILSFDNITSRGYLPLRNIDKYLVWNKQMKKELIDIYNIEESRLSIIGSPQFSFHYKTPDIINKDLVYNRYNIPKNYKYIVYASNHFYHTPNEQEVVENIILNIIKQTKKMLLVLRLHPLDDYNRWDKLINKYQQFIRVSFPWKKENNEIVAIKKDDIYELTGLLYYALLVFNIASTITIDASILDTPIISIGYHPTKQKESDYYYNVHYSNHYKNIMQLKAAPLVTNDEELLKEFMKLTSDNDDYKINRKILVDFFIGNTLNRSEELFLKYI